MPAARVPEVSVESAILNQHQNRILENWEHYQSRRYNLKRQKFCDKPECKVASKKHSQQKWLSKPQNRGHFSGPANVIRVQQWREQNPGYWKLEEPQKAVPLFESALQETLSAKTADGKGFPSDLMQTALQDSLLAKSLVIIGFDTQLNKTALGLVCYIEPELKWEKLKSIMLPLPEFSLGSIVLKFNLFSRVFWFQKKYQSYPFLLENVRFLCKYNLKQRFLLGFQFLFLY